jgi:hypothetical protein
VCYVVRKTSPKLECVILTTLLFAGAENTNNRGHTTSGYMIGFLMIENNVLHEAVE